MELRKIRAQAQLNENTVEKWKLENDKELNTSIWLMADRIHVGSLSCSVCTQFKEKLRGMCNYNPAYIDGSKNLHALSFKDHAASDMHARAMLLLKKAQSTDARDYAPIAKALHTMDSSMEQQMKTKFDIAFTIARENMAYAKMKPICELEERHGVRYTARKSSSSMLPLSVLASAWMLKNFALHKASTRVLQLSVAIYLMNVVQARLFLYPWPRFTQGADSCRRPLSPLFAMLTPAPSHPKPMIFFLQSLPTPTCVIARSKQDRRPLASPLSSFRTAKNGLRM